MPVVKGDMRNDTTKQETAGAEIIPPIQSLQAFCAAVPISPITAWRLRKKGWLDTINIAGRQYVTSEAIIKFKRRAQAGEFAKEHRTPRTATAAAQ